jgi:succinate dehydrogenase flavin-adding protein (antitoxin of CptAB toxin-antitoxin module)
MRELDGLLERFVEVEMARLGEEEMRCFEGILELPDPVLHAYLVGRNAPDDPLTAGLIERIRASVVSKA